MKENPYDILGINRAANDDQIKAAFRSLVKKHHPDMNSGDDSAVEKFKAVIAAYEILSDPIKRAQYDGGKVKFKTPPKSNPGKKPGFSFDEVEIQFFGGSKFRGRNITCELEISFKEAAFGCKKYIKFKKQKACDSCHGEGYTDYKICTVCQGVGQVQTWDYPLDKPHKCKSCDGTGRYFFEKCVDCVGTGKQPGFEEIELEVVIPAGAMSGHQIRFSGLGEDPKSKTGTRQPGDVIVFVIVKDHAFFKRDGNNLLLEVPVSYTQLVLGDEIDIPTLDSIYKLRIPAGTQSHRKFQIPNMGILNGNLIVSVKVELPQELNKEYKDILANLAKLENEFLTPLRKKWANREN